MMTARRAGFTLIELLVVMGIIAGLAGIILPVVSTTRGMAQQTVCVSSLRQIGLAWTMYVDDWGWQPPRLGDMVDSGHLRVPELLVCPSDPTGDLTNMTDPTEDDLWWRRYPTSYEYVGRYPQYLQEAVLATGPSAGIAVCVVHGRLPRPGGQMQLREWDYDGLKLRLCADGSVVKRNNLTAFDVQCEYLGRITGQYLWLVFTDLPLESAPKVWRGPPCGEVIGS